MRPFNLEEYLANPSKKVITRGGSAVKIHCTNYRDEKPIIAEIEGSGQSISYDKDGRYFSDTESVRDLFFNGEKHEGWLNVYRRTDTSTSLSAILYSSREYAEEIGKCDDRYVTTAKVEWEE